jgi:hypothetical protein
MPDTPRRRTPRWPWVLGVVVLAAALAVPLGPRVGGWLHGRAEAALALTKGQGNLLTTEPLRDARGVFDPETGLFARRPSGTPGGWTSGFVSGWNDAMRAAAAEGKFDAISLRHKVTSLGAMQARFAAEKGFELPADGTPVRDASKRWQFSVDADGTLQVRDLRAWATERTLVPVRGARCLLADSATTLWIRDADGRTCRTVDLPGHIELQVFTADAEPRAK